MARIFMFNDFFLRIVPTVRGNTCTVGRPHMTIWRMRIAFRITKATNTHSQSVILTGILYSNGCTNAPLCYITVKYSTVQ